MLVQNATEMTYFMNMYCKVIIVFLICYINVKWL